MKRFLNIAFFRASFLICGFAATVSPLSVAAVDDAGEFIKSLVAERKQCRDRFKEGKSEEAVEPCRAWVTLAPDNAERAEALSVLGQVYAQSGDIDEAKSSLDEAVSYLDRGRDADSLEKWVRLQALRARLAEGRDLMEDARLIYFKTEERVRALLGQKSIPFGLAAENRAAFLARQGDLPGATALYAQAVGAYDATFGAYNERSLETVLNLAVAQLDHQLNAEAEKTLQTLLGAMKLGKRDKSEGAAEALTFLGNLQVEKRDFGAALSYYRKALEVRQGLHGQRDLRTAQSLNNLGIVHLKMGNLKQAEEMLSSAYAIRVSALGPEDSLTIGSLEAVRAVIELQKDARKR